MFTINWPRIDTGSLFSRTLPKRSISTLPAPPQAENCNALHSVPYLVLAPTVRPGGETGINDSYCQRLYSLATQSSERLCLLILLPIDTICWGFAMHLMQCILYLILTRSSEICTIISIWQMRILRLRQLNDLPRITHIVSSHSENLMAS